jgi:hypothetical protein
MRQLFPNVYVSLGILYQARREARRAALALGAYAPEHEAIVIDCACARCRRPIAAAITFRFNPAGDVISHEFFPGSIHCPTCGLPFHARNLLYVPASRQSPAAELPDEALNENNSEETKISKGSESHVTATAGERDVSA